MPRSLADLDPETIEALRWRTSDPADSWPYLLALAIAGAVVTVLWVTWKLRQRVHQRARGHGRRPERRFSAGPQSPGSAARGSAARGSAGTPGLAVAGDPARGLSPGDRARAVVRMIRGEDPDDVAAELGVTTAVLRGWLERFLNAGREALSDEPWTSHRTPG